MDWLKKNYDLALACLGALATAASAALLALPSTPATASAPPPGAQRPAKTGATADIGAVLRAKEALNAAPKIGSLDSTESQRRGSPFVSRSYILAEGRLIDPIEGGEDLHPPLANAWIIAHGLDYADSVIKEADPDGDGFTNLEEFEGRTDPNDAKSLPPAFTKLRLVEFTPIPFRLEFKGDPSGDGEEFQINLRDLKGQSRTQYKKIGDLIDAGPDRPPYKIVAYSKKEGPNERGTTTDLSELTVENTATGGKIVLTFNREANDPASVGVFHNELTGAELTLRKGEEFTLPPDTSSKFKVVDISEASAQIQDLQTDAVLKVVKPQNTVPAPQ
jgi:hypothetical protein